MFALIVCWLKSLIVTHCSAFMNVVGSIRIVLGTGCYCVGVLVIGLVLAGGTVVGQTPDSKSTNGTAASDGGLDRLITKLVLDSIPHTFTETKKWGMQEERFDGFKRERDGLKLKVSRRKKMVNHGNWKKYSVSLRNAEEKFAIRVKDMRELPGNSVGFNVDFLADLDVSGRQSKWVKGVQLYSLSAKGHAQVRLRLAVELEVKTDRKTFPPDLLFVPKVTSADIQLDQFRIDRVGKAGGEFAQQLSRQVRPLLEKKIEDKQARLVDKINKKIVAKQDRLRLPISKAVDSKWGKLSEKFLPDSVKEAVE